MMGMMDGMMVGGMLLWGLIGLVLLVLGVMTAVWLGRRLFSGQSQSDAEDVLRRRYAAGEVDREEFLRAQQDLAGR